MKSLIKLCSMLLLSVGLGANAVAAEEATSEFDIVINHGRVMDPETQFDQIANVGVKDGKIVAITQDIISGKETIDAKGLVVAPGFIDTHTHVIHPSIARLYLRDGRTSVMDLEIGVYGPKIDAFYKQHEGKSPLNYGASVSHEFSRSAVLDGFNDWQLYHTPDAIRSRAFGSAWSKVKPDQAQTNQILSTTDEGLRQGGIGIGSTLGYMRDGVSAREVFEMQKLAGLYGRPIAMHFRGTPGNEVTEVNGIQEMLANAAALGAPAIACHFNNHGYNLVHEIMVKMREQGHNVWGELYPYEAGSTTLNAVFLEPEVWVDELGYKYEETVMDIKTGEFYTEQSRAEMLKKEPTRLVVIFKMPSSAIIDWLRMPGVALASDGGSIPKPGAGIDLPFEELNNMHPRGAGTYARALRIARENNIPLMQVVAMSSYNTALPMSKMGFEFMQLRGRMQEGMIADITMFDPETVQDNATYETGTIPSSGIPHVIINGVIVMRDSEYVSGAYPGQPIRFKVEEEGRFQPLSEESWKEEFQVDVVDFSGAALTVDLHDKEVHLH
ncbi:amidohydrolase family protein [Agarivorans litoreus]|uniref:amidohydrolase family protein n=1 Tax=Agarivorans litoreus TaxID=1510455 RepID=UPI001C7CAA76|nr:amidohydrolase family protein [Agarivorans litoreus]